jgi:hypothetical protein
MAIRASRSMLIAGSLVCGVVVVILSFVAVVYSQYPAFRDEGLPLVLFFDAVFVYRSYWYMKLIPPKKKIRA